MKVFIEPENEIKEIEFSGTVSELLKKLNINPETVIAAKNDELVPEDEELKDGDEVKLLAVISGGYKRIL